MKKSLKCAALAAVLTIALCFTGCGSKETTEGVDHTNNQVTVTLAANPTTGYTWGAKIDNEALMSFVSDVYEPKQTEEGVTGSGGFDHITFEAKAPGTATITLTYAQQWDGGQTADTRVVTVVIDDKSKVQTVSMSQAAGTGSASLAESIADSTASDSVADSSASDSIPDSAASSSTAS